MPPKPSGASSASSTDEVESQDGTTTSKLPTFSGDANLFKIFKFKLEAAFNVRGLGDVFTKENPDAALDEKAFNILVTLCSGSAIEVLMDMGRTKKCSLAIERLTEKYESPSQDRQCTLHIDIFRREFRPDDTVDIFHDDIMAKRRDLINIGPWAVIPDQLIRSLVIAKISAVEKFANVATAALADNISIEGKSDAAIKTMFSTKLDELFSQMRVAESTANRIAEASNASAFAAVKAEHKAGKGKSKFRQHGNKDDFCTFCGINNHTVQNCRTKARCEKLVKEGKVTKNTALATPIAKPHLSPLSLVVDTGATSSMVSFPSAFAEMTPTRGTVTVATGASIPSLGKGTIVLPVKDDQRKTVNLTLNNALLTPDLAFNLLSPNSVVRDSAGKPTGHSFIDGPQGPLFLLADGTKIPLTHKNGLTELHSGFALHSQQKRMTALEVHELLGHLNFDQVRTFAAQAGIALTNDEDPFCTACALGKSTRVPVPQKSADRSERETLMFHSDIIPFETPSLGGYYYAVVFILDKSRLARVYGMKRKNEIGRALEEFVTDMQVYSQTRLFAGEKSILQADSGTEYKAKSFVATCARLGIEVRYAPPKTQAKNSVAERFIRTLTEMCRTLLIAANKPPAYWFLSLKHACFLRNISPTKALKDSAAGVTPYQHAKGKTFDLTLLQKWGISVYTHVEREDRTRLAPRGRKGIYVGFDESSACAKVFFPDTKTLVSAYHVHFDNSPVTPQSPLSATSDPFDDDDVPVPPAQPIHTEGLPPPATPLSHTALSDLPPLPTPLREDGIPPPAALVTNGQEHDSPSKDEGETHAPPSKHDPLTMKEAMESDESEEWMEAFNIEVENLESMGTFVPVRRKDLPPGTRVLGHKIVFKTKYDENGLELKKKCRIVAKGFMENTDGQQTFAPVSNYSTIRTVLSLAASLDLELYQCDIKSAYLMASLPADRETFMEIPEGIQNKDDEGYELVWQLKKSLYGLASAGRLWSDKLCKFMEKQGFKRSHNDPALYIRGKAGKGLFMITTWVDDLILAASRKDVENFMQAIESSELDASAHGDLHFILNMQIKRDREKRTITLSQSSYIRNLLESFHMQDAKKMLTPLPPHTTLSAESDDIISEVDTSIDLSRYRELVGSLNYLANTVRADISFAVGQLSRYLAKPRPHHWHAATHCLKYLKGTADLGVTYNGDVDNKNVIIGYADSDYAGDKSNARSTSGYVFMLNGAAISWRSQRQSVVAQSTAEAELMSASLAAQEAIHLRMLLGEMGLKQGPIKIYEDNQPCIKIAENPINSDRTKHIHVRFFFVRERVQRNEIQLEYKPTNEMVADCLTKSLESTKVVGFRKAIMGAS